jgi:hypothetical protein
MVKYRIVKNGLGEYGILGPKGEKVPVELSYPSRYPHYWSTNLNKVQERINYLTQTDLKNRLRNNWEVVG